jgi:hypothetical protein
MRRIGAIGSSDRLGGSDSGAVMLTGQYRCAGHDDPPRVGLVVADTHFWPSIYGPFLNRVCMVEGMVAAEAEPGPPRALAPGSIAGETHPAARRLLDRPFTDPTPGTEEIRMATAATECFAIVTDRRRQFRAALRIAAAMPQILAFNRHPRQ